MAEQMKQSRGATEKGWRSNWNESLGRWAWGGFLFALFVTSYLDFLLGPSICISHLDFLSGLSLWMTLLSDLDFLSGLLIPTAYLDFLVP